MDVFKKHKHWGQLADLVISQYFHGPCDALETFFQDKEVMWKVRMRTIL